MRALLGVILYPDVSPRAMKSLAPCLPTGRLTGFATAVATAAASPHKCNNPTHYNFTIIRAHHNHLRHLCSILLLPTSPHKCNNPTHYNFTIIRAHHNHLRYLCSILLLPASSHKCNNPTHYTFTLILRPS